MNLNMPSDQQNGARQIMEYQRKRNPRTKSNTPYPMMIGICLSVI
ncbi:hypothetical protein XBO1_2520016 [Xenorhabdus bovienii str. oregonense]|uniref:Uncharacterized protein n=1 Tax=Xenorhabdus bovienii str. oregonense TaxID=1398202 RepID=A0A077P7B3_XENBV|nr:hypothetical protein XBO1_2520016 [Xenorhabdus bovienii str. oregonense]